MEITFKGQVALVTGAASGMGFTTAKSFAQAGAMVALADINKTAVEEAAKKLSDEGYKVLPIICDVSNG